jgi:serine/threonine protein kinase
MEGPLLGKEYLFEERTTCLIGRAADCEMQLPNDPEHRGVSRHHCVLDVNPPHVRIRDFGSRNGTFVNGVKIGQRAAGPEDRTIREESTEHDLRDNDEVRVGRTVFRVLIRSGAATDLAGTRAEQGDGRSCDKEMDNPADVVERLLATAPPEAPGLESLHGYEVKRLLGHGGMASVFLLRHRESGEEMALKIMRPRGDVPSDACQRFLREAETTRALCHPNVVALRQVGYCAETFFLGLEYCNRGTVADRIERRGKMPARDALAITFQALAALEYAHSVQLPVVQLAAGGRTVAQGLVHRDIKPNNLFLHHAGGVTQVKVGDYGLAKAFDAAGLSGFTRTGATAGTPWFMPRQQLVNFKYARPEVDIWSLAASLYFMLTGKPPRVFPEGCDWWRQVLETRPIAIRKREPSVPARLAAVIDRALVDQPAIVFQSAPEFREALQAASLS